jgi:hypothetical protein
LGGSEALMLALGKLTEMKYNEARLWISEATEKAKQQKRQRGMKHENQISYHCQFRIEMITIPGNQTCSITS